jgi:predicted PurR-regulated permease PerM
LIISVVFTLIANPVVTFLKGKLKFKILAVATTHGTFILILVGFNSAFVPLNNKSS